MTLVVLDTLWPVAAVAVVVSTMLTLRALPSAAFAPFVSLTTSLPEPPLASFSVAEPIALRSDADG